MYRFNLLQDFLLQGTSRDQTVDVDNLLLTDTMGAIHGLDILLRVPVMFHENDGVCTCKVETQSTNAGSQEQDVITGVGVETVDNVLALGCFHAHRPGGGTEQMEGVS